MIATDLFEDMVVTDTGLDYLRSDPGTVNWLTKSKEGYNEEPIDYNVIIVTGTASAYCFPIYGLITYTSRNQFSDFLFNKSLNEESSDADLENWEPLGVHITSKELEAETVAASEKKEFIAKTELGRKLWETRAKILASGIPMLDMEELEQEIADRRGEYH